MVANPENPTTGLPFCTRAEVIVSASSPRSERVHIVAPLVNRSSTKSVSGLTITWPPRPCGRAIRPTSTMSSQLIDDFRIDELTKSATANLSSSQNSSVRQFVNFSIANVQLRPRAVLLGRQRHQGSQRRRRSSLPPDNLAHIPRSGRQLEHGRAAPFALVHVHRSEERRVGKEWRARW